MNHFGGTLSRVLWIARVSEFDVFLASVEDDPDDPAQSMGNRPDGLVVPQSRDPTLVQGLKDAALGLTSRVSRLIENPPHGAVPFRSLIALGHFRRLFAARANSHPGRQFLGTREGGRLVRRCDKNVPLVADDQT